MQNTAIFLKFNGPLSPGSRHVFVTFAGAHPPIHSTKSNPRAKFPHLPASLIMSFSFD
jgi:hypothetical protein